MRRLMRHKRLMLRVYAAFRDPDGNVLICNDETELEVAWDFIIT